MTSIIILSIVGAIIAAAVGTFWYSDKTPMGRLHMQYLGFDKLSDEEKRQKMEEVKPKMKKIYGAQILLSSLTAFAVVYITIVSMRNGMSLSNAFGFVFFNWLCFVVPTVGTGILWGTCDPKIAWKKFFSDISSVLVTLLITTLLASLFV